MKTKDIKHNDFWGGAQQVMQTAVRSAIAAAGDALPEEVRYYTSWRHVITGSLINVYPSLTLT